ncbi:HIT family protein [Vaginisenegalia massiliensis]|uniref:HIT family protein n=1 Tax=Vaginisenegalia massiliensis TaxID=2058294 RepID=UPI000F51F97C|nr:HIT family protein [Vaginisenegalia massiliensis]
MEDCIFCKIVAGEIPCHKVYEDELVLAFLDISQVTPGHTLVIPKQHVTDIFAYEDDLAGQVFARIPKIARAMEQAFPDMKGLNIVNNNRPLAYQSVFHSHFHLIPRYHKEDGFGLTFTNHQADYDAESLGQIASKLSNQLS